MPSVRGLSVTLSVNPNTIQKAYSELTLRGILVAVPGKGLFVSENALEVLLSEAQKKVTELEGLVSLLKLSGIGKDEILKSINKIYEGEGNK